MQAPSQGQERPATADLVPLPKKGVKFSSQQEHQELKDGQRVVTLVSADHGTNHADSRMSKSASQRRRMWRKVAVRLSPRYWVHVLNKSLPVVLPESKGRMAWDFVIVALVIYNCVIVPYQVGYSTPAPHILNPINYATDLLFAIDICLNFRTAYVDNSANLVRDGRMIARHYSTRWFPIDMVSTIPFDLLLTATASNLSEAQLTALALLRTPRLLRLVRLLRVLDRIKGANVIRMLKLLFLMASMAHWISCFWHLIYKLDRGDMPWTFDEVGSDVEITVFLQGYLNTLYIMVGNDVLPANDVERLYCTFVLVLGACFYAIVVGNMSLLVNNLNPTASRHRFKKDIINNTIRYLDIPKELAARINVYFDFLTQYSHPGTDGMALVNQLPSSMAQDINSFCYRAMIMKVPLFRDTEESFITQLVMRLKLSVYLTGEVIFKIGDVGHEMYFISKGDVAVLNGNQELLAMLSKGGFFGELALLATARRTAHCVSVSQCDLAMLMANDLVSAMRDFPDSAASVRACAVNRLSELQAAGTVAETHSPEDAPAHIEEADEYGDDADEDQEECDPGSEDERTSPGGETSPKDGFDDHSTGQRPNGGSIDKDDPLGDLTPSPFRAMMASSPATRRRSMVKYSSQEALPQAQSMSRQQFNSTSRQTSGIQSRRPSGMLTHRNSARVPRIGSQLGHAGEGVTDTALARPVSRMLSSRAAPRGLTTAASNRHMSHVIMNFNPANSKEWFDGNLRLMGQMHTIVTRLNGKLDTMGGRLDQIRVRMREVETTKDPDPFHDMQRPAADTMMDFDMG